MIKVYAKLVLLFIVKSYRNDENIPFKGGHYRYNFTIDFFFQLFSLEHRLKHASINRLRCVVYICGCNSGYR